MDIVTYLHGDKEDAYDLCGEHGLDPDVYGRKIFDCLYEVKIKIRIDESAGTATIIEIDDTAVS